MFTTIREVRTNNVPNLSAVRESVAESPEMSIRHGAQELDQSSA